MKKIFFISFFLFFFLIQNVYGLQRESAHFIYYYESPDSSIIDTVISRLEGAYDGITGDLHLTISEKVKVHIYPTLQEFHNAVGRPSAPDWFVGLGITEIYVVSPLNPGPAHSYNSVMNNVFIHEFTHVCTGKINRNLPLWLSEGFALYEGGPYYDKEDVVSAYQGLNRIPTLDELSFNYTSFADIGGYPFSLTIAYFIINNFGMDAMREFIYHPNNFLVFSGLSKSEFEEKWFEYVKENYLDISSNDFYSNQFKPTYTLEQNYPNPFNPITKIQFTVPNFGTPYAVSLRITDILGMEVTTLLNEEKSIGEYEVEFDGSNLSSGIYFYSIKIENLNNNSGFIQTRKMTLLR